MVNFVSAKKTIFDHFINLFDPSRLLIRAKETGRQAVKGGCAVPLARCVPLIVLQALTMFKSPEKI